jgi:hypothetical protein
MNTLEHMAMVVRAARQAHRRWARTRSPNEANQEMVNLEAALEALDNCAIDTIVKTTRNRR